jgi:hypothetical protein
MWQKKPGAFMYLSVALVLLTGSLFVGGCSQVRSSDKKESASGFSFSLPSLPTSLPSINNDTQGDESTSGQAEEPQTSEDVPPTVDTAPTTPETTPSPPATTPSDGFLKGCVTVQFKEGVSEETARGIVLQHGGTVDYIWNTRQDAARYQITVQLCNGKDENQAVAEFKAEPTVEWAERVAIVRPTS